VKRTIVASATYLVATTCLCSHSMAGDSVRYLPESRYQKTHRAERAYHAAQPIREAVKERGIFETRIEKTQYYYPAQVQNYAPPPQQVPQQAYAKPTTVPTMQPPMQRAMPNIPNQPTVNTPFAPPDQQHYAFDHYAPPPSAPAYTPPSTVPQYAAPIPMAAPQPAPPPQAMTYQSTMPKQQQAYAQNSNPLVGSAYQGQARQYRSKESTYAKPRNKDWHVSVGLAAAMYPEYEGADDQTFWPMPIIDVNWKNIAFVKSPNGFMANDDRFIGANFYHDENIAFGTALGYRKGYDRGDVNGLPNAEIDDAFELGLFIDYFWPMGGRDHWRFTGQMFGDFMDAHEGIITTLAGAYQFWPSKNLRFEFEAATDIASGNYMQNYLGAEDDITIKDLRLTMEADYMFYKQWSWRNWLQYKQLVGESADGVLATQGQEGQLRFATGVAYTF
jgi:outer membrane protein